MTRYLTTGEVRDLHRYGIEAFGGSYGLASPGALDSALAQPQMTFSGHDLYPTLIDKTAALGYSLIKNHAFIDGNKRVGLYSMVTFVEMNGSEFICDNTTVETVILQVAAGEMTKDDFKEWVSTVVVTPPPICDAG